MQVSDLVSKLEIKSLNRITETEIKDVLVADIVSDVVTHAKVGTIIVTAQAHSTLVSAAKLVDAAAIIFTLGREPSPEVIKLADKAGITLFTSPLGGYEIAVRLNKLGL